MDLIQALAMYHGLHRSRDDGILALEWMIRVLAAGRT